MKLFNDYFAAIAFGIFVTTSSNQAVAQDGNIRSGEFSTSFEILAPYARLDVLSKRMLHGLTYKGLVEQSRKGDVRLNVFTLDPRQEKWLVYVPEHAGARPNSGEYGILVWYQENLVEIPEPLKNAARSSGIIVVAPLNIGTDRDFIGKRAALGLHGLNWVVNQYPVDASRIAVGGMEEASEIAEGLALAYGDVFKGALLVNGGIAPGKSAMPVPSSMIMERIRKNSRFVLLSEPSEVSGKNDMNKMLEGFEDLCIPGVSRRRLPDSVERLRADDVRNALDSIFDPSKLQLDTQCLTRLEEEMFKMLDSVDALIRKRRAKTALDALVEVHLKYGGLAEQEVFERYDRLSELFEEFKQDAVNLINSSNRTPVRQLTRPPTPGQ